MIPSDIESIAAISVFIIWASHWTVTRLKRTYNCNRQEYLRRTGVRQYSFADRGFVWAER